MRGDRMRMSSAPFFATATVLAGSLALTGCSSSSNDNEATPSASASTSVPQLDVSAFTADFCAMEQLEGRRRPGQGHDRGPAARHDHLDALRPVRRPLLEQAFQAAGPVRRPVQDRQRAGKRVDHADPGRRGRSPRAPRVLLVDPLDSGSGAAIESEGRGAGRQGHRLRPPGARAARPDRYYVSFDNVQVGEPSARAWSTASPPGRCRSPNILVMDGDPDRQQRQAVRAGLQRRPAAEVR